jgi:Flp pilus assembly pilin Flp
MPNRPILWLRSQRGQATTEYALVLLGAAAVALLLVAWATRTGALGALLDAVLANIRRRV